MYIWAYGMEQHNTIISRPPKEEQTRIIRQLMGGPPYEAA